MTQADKIKLFELKLKLLRETRTEEEHYHCIKDKYDSGSVSRNILEAYNSSYKVVRAKNVQVYEIIVLLNLSDEYSYYADKVINRKIKAFKKIKDIADAE